MFETPALWVMFVAMVPLMFIAARTDLKTLLIPNWLVLAVFGVFLVTGLWGLPLETFFWRLGIAFVVLLIGFVLFNFGVIGGGDAKLTAALAPFIVPADLFVLTVLYTVVTFAMLLVLRLVMQAYRHEETGWLAVDQLHKPARQRVFPVGLILGLTLTIYLGAHTLQSLGVDLGL